MTHHEIEEFQSAGKSVNVGGTERFISMLLGGFMAVSGLKKRSAGGLATALAGGYLMYRGKTGHCGVYQALGVDTSAKRGIELDESILINRPVNELYAFWRNLENLPGFMKHLEEVKVMDEKLSHWGAIAPGGIKIEWDAEITAEKENEYIGWRSLPFSDVDNQGFVEFKEAPGHRGTILRVHMVYNLPGGGASSAVARLLSTISFRQVREELRRFKQMMEAGEPPEIEEKPSGRRASGE